MKKISAILCYLLLFSSFCLAENPKRFDYNQPSLLPSESLFQPAFPNIFHPFKQIFKKVFRREKLIDEYNANVYALFIDRNDITAGCSLTSNSCSKIQTINIETVANDPENDVLTYEYSVTAGKIIGKGSKVIWDLSNVAPGTYTITAGVDDGCGVCGTTKTQTVKIIECPNCN